MKWTRAAVKAVVWSRRAVHYHTPVLKSEVTHYLKPEKGKLLIDMTFGGGGHTRQLLAVCPEAQLICLDRDPIAHQIACNLAKQYPEGQVIPLLGKFSQLPSLLESVGVKIRSLDGILFDFGCSSMQMDCVQRGFAVSRDSPLDMRMNASVDCEDPTAAEVLKYADEDDLTKIFKIYGEEKHARKIARSIIEARFLFKPLNTTKDLASLVADTLMTEYRADKLQRPSHVATKIFQALRIFVNDELNEIDFGLLLALRYLRPGGRLVAISFHSLEDRIVKNHLTGHDFEQTDSNPVPLKLSDCSSGEIKSRKNKEWAVLTKQVVTPTEEEIESNPRSRSAKLRAAIKM